MIKMQKDNLGPITAKQKQPRRDSRNRQSAHTTRKQSEGGSQPIQEVENETNQIEMEEQLTKTE